MKKKKPEGNKVTADVGKALSAGKAPSATVENLLIIAMASTKNRRKRK